MTTIKYRVVINRTSSRHFLSDNKGCYNAVIIAADYNFDKLNPQDIIGLNDIEWIDNEYDNLIMRNGELYKFVRWVDEYPFSGIMIEKVGMYTPVITN